MRRLYLLIAVVAATLMFAASAGSAWAKCYHLCFGHFNCTEQCFELPIDPITHAK